MKIGVLISHHSHVEWARKRWPDCILIAREYITIQSHPKETFSYFHPAGDDGINWEGIVNHLSDFWYRDEEGLDIVFHEGFSLAQVLTGSMRISLATQFRDYEALKYWCFNLSKIYISKIESDSIKRAVDNWIDKVEFYEPPNNCLPISSSSNGRILSNYLSPTQNRAFQFTMRILCNVQRFVLRVTRKPSYLIFSDWTNSEQLINQNCLWTNHRNLRRSALIYTTKENLEKSKKIIDGQEITFVNEEWMTTVFQSCSEKIDKKLVKTVVSCVHDLVNASRHYLVIYHAQISQLFRDYNIETVQLPAELFEPYVVALQIAKARGIRTCLRIDGHDPTGLGVPKLRSQNNEEYLFDEFFACSDLLYSSAINKGFREDQIIRSESVFSETHYKIQEKKFDVIVMTWIPNNYNPRARNDSPSMTLESCLTILRRLIHGKIAVKIKNSFSESEYVNSVIAKLGMIDSVEILTGDFAEHLRSSKVIIGGISSAIAEAKINKIDYIIYEPIDNGYSETILSQSDVLDLSQIARNEYDLILKIAETGINIDQNA
jgi:hypothetical protein